jgi:glucose/arabinose dehydrogenase
MKRLILFTGCLAIVAGVMTLLAPSRPARNKILVPAVFSQVGDSVTIEEKVVATGLDVPWDITWGPDNWIWFTEQKGLVRKANPSTGEVRTILRIPEVHMQRAVGLLGLAIHPDIKRYPYVFVDYSYLVDSTLFLKVVRYRYEEGELVQPTTIVDKIPATETHNGSRIIFDATGRLLITTGDIDRGRLSQDVKSPNGKILRINIDGTIPSDNPITGNPVWSWGHRNAQGLVWASNGNIYSSEHGDVTDDEINLIRKGGNYGWPRVEGVCDTPKEQGFCNDSSVVEALKIWTPTIAPAGIEYYGSHLIPQWHNSILVTTLKDASLRVLQLNASGNAVESEQTYLSGKYGRLRDVCVSPSGDVYISTSNRDWNKTAGPGFPADDDDKIIRLSVGKAVAFLAADQPNSKETHSVAERGAVLYRQYCESCHKSDGNGLTGVFPALRGSPYLHGEPKALIAIVVAGLDREQYLQAMPAFDFLADDQIADLLNYVRRTFGKPESVISADDVKATRLRK